MPQINLLALALRPPIWRSKSLSMQGQSEAFVRTIMLADEAATVRLGAQLASALKPGDAIALTGELGAGKTMLARAMLRSLDIAEEVPSPTFTLVQHYETSGLTIDHFDLYRIEEESEVDQLGLEDALSSGAALIEWPERAGSRLPEDVLNVKLDITGPNSRQAIISGSGQWEARLFENVPHES